MKDDEKKKQQYTHIHNEKDKCAALCVYHCESCKPISVYTFFYIYIFMTHFPFNASCVSVTWTPMNAIYASTWMTTATTMTIWVFQAKPRKNYVKTVLLLYIIKFAFNAKMLRGYASRYEFPNKKTMTRENVRYSKVFFCKWCNQCILLPFSLPKETHPLLQHKRASLNN